MAYDDAYEPPPSTVRTLIEAANRGKKKVVISCDANAHHTIWGSTDINTRGESLFNYIIGTNLEICNKGDVPTFITVNRREVLDITLATKIDGFMVEGWRVSSEPSFSDHCMILFNVKFSCSTVNSYRNARKTDWIRFREVAANKLETEPLESMRTGREIDNAVNTLTNALTEAFERTCIVSKAG